MHGKMAIVVKHQNGCYQAFDGFDEKLVLSAWCDSWMVETLMNYGYEKIVILNKVRS